MKRVLVVDDAKFMRMMLGGMLEKAGCTIVGEAVDGEEAIVRYRECQPDLVTLDITMPNRSGLEALTDIMKENPKAKVIMCSAMGQQAMVVEAIRGGAKDFLVKPFTEERVKDAISRIM